MTNNNKKLNATLKSYLKIRTASAEMCGKEHTHTDRIEGRDIEIFSFKILEMPLAIEL